MDCPAPVPEAPRPGDEPAAGSLSNALSTPEMPLIDPILVDWLDGLGTDGEDTLDASSGTPSDDGLSADSEGTLDAGEPAEASDAPPSHDVYVMLPDLAVPVPEALATDEPAGSPAQEEILPLVDSPSTEEDWGVDFPGIFDVYDSSSVESEGAFDAFDAPSHDANTSPPPLPPQLPLAGLEGVRLEWVERLSRPDRAAPAARTEMVSTRQSTGGVIEDTAPELRLQRLIQVSEQHHIVPATRNQRATSPEAERLAQAIQRSHSSLDASRRQNLDANGRMEGTGDVKKDGNCCACNSSFDCNICLDAAKEPVVTPCGHLFCWPCLYQWLHGHSVHGECPVCKREVLEVNVTPIYGRGGGERDTSSNDVPPRPSANTSESTRQQLQMPDPRSIESMVRRLIENPDHFRGQAAPLDVTLPDDGTRVTRTVRRTLPPSLSSPSPVTFQHVRLNAARSRILDRIAESGNPVQLLSSNSFNAAPAVPQQSSSVEQASTSSTVAVIVGQAAQSRRSRPPSEPATTRRTRRRQQQ